MVESLKGIMRKRRHKERKQSETKRAKIGGFIIHPQFNQINQSSTVDAVIACSRVFGVLSMSIIGDFTHVRVILHR